MNEFAWALAAFVLIHVGISATGLRTVLVRAIGEGPYRGLFALVSLALIIPVNMGLWFAPALVALQDASPARAIGQSFRSDTATISAYRPSNSAVCGSG